MDILIKPCTLSGKIRAISSKSDVHRLLIAAALASGVTKVHFTTLSEDIKATVNVLSAMGARIEIVGDDGDYIASVCGIKQMPRGIALDANECGTTARLILPLAAALADSFTLTGKNGLMKRPFKELCDCIAQNDTACSDTFLPITASGKLNSGKFKIRGDVSSQYISGLLFALPLLNGNSEIHITSTLVSAGYVDMTVNTLKKFGVKIEKMDYGFFVKGNQSYKSSGTYFAEGDWSNATFWLCANALGASIALSGLDKASLQKDKNIIEILDAAQNGKNRLQAVSFNGEDIPDALPALATVLSLAKGKSIITGGSRLKIKESDRIATTTAMLSSLGATIEGTDDGFIINGVDTFRGGEVDGANDHRIAMSAAIASQCATGDIIIRGAECVNKSYPTFFEDFKKLGGKFDVING